MDQRYQLIEALLHLSDSAQKIAKLLEQTQIIGQPDELIAVATNLRLNIAELSCLQPITSYKKPPLQLVCDNLRVLELASYDSYLLSNAKLKQLDVYYKSDRIDKTADYSNVKVISSLDSISDLYDVIFVNEFLEFITDPVGLLIRLKQYLWPNGKIYIRFRPWSASHGGFQEYNGILTPYAHIVSDIYNEDNLPLSVVNKIIKPINNYQKIVRDADYMIVSQNIKRHESPLPDTVFNAVSSNLWGHISKEEASKLLLIHNVDFIICPN